MLTTFVLSLASLDCNTLRYAYQTSVLEDGSTGCCAGGTIAGDSCAADAELQDKMKFVQDGLLRTLSYNPGQLYKITEEGVRVWSSGYPTNYALAGSPPAGTVGTLERFKLCPMVNKRLHSSDWGTNTTADFFGPMFSLHGLSELASYNNEKDLITLKESIGRAERTRTLSDLVEPPSIASSITMSDLVVTQNNFGYDIGYDPFNILRTNSLNDLIFSYDTFKDSGASNYIAFTKVPYKNYEVSFDYYFDGSVATTRPTPFSMERRQQFNGGFFISMIDNTKTGSIRQEDFLQINIWRLVNAFFTGFTDKRADGGLFCYGSTECEAYNGPGRGYPIMPSNAGPPIPVDEALRTWHNMRVEHYGKSLRVTVDGKVLTWGPEENTVFMFSSLEGGYVGFEAEGENVIYRNVKINKITSI